jgi:hypothetical protein
MTQYETGHGNIIGRLAVEYQGLSNRHDTLWNGMGRDARDSKSAIFFESKRLVNGSSIRGWRAAYLRGVGNQAGVLEQSD